MCRPPGFAVCKIGLRRLTPPAEMCRPLGCFIAQHLSGTQYFPSLNIHQSLSVARVTQGLYSVSVILLRRVKPERAGGQLPSCINVEMGTESSPRTSLERRRRIQSFICPSRVLSCFSLRVIPACPFDSQATAYSVSGRYTPKYLINASSTA